MEPVWLGATTRAASGVFSGHPCKCAISAMFRIPMRFTPRFWITSRSAPTREKSSRWQRSLRLRTQGDQWFGYGTTNFSPMQDTSNRTDP